jgi:CRAL/TRIO domain
MATIEDDKDSIRTADDFSSAASDVVSMKKMLMETKDESGKSMWATSLETIGMVDGGKRKKDDIMCSSFDDAMKVFSELIKDMALEWSFQSTPFADFSASKDDLIEAFVHWSHKIDDNSDNTNEPVLYNLSKAYRRISAYVEWMDKNCKELNLNGSTMKEISDMWKMKCTHDSSGRLVWWFDLESIDLKLIKATISPDDTLRYFVWFSHLILFDKQCQQNGVVIVESVGNASFTSLMSAVSMEVKSKFDRLPIGVLPIKMKAVIVVHSPTWFRMLMALMSTFMGAKMRKRIQIVPNATDTKEYLEESLGKDCIPTGFAHLEGNIEKDILFKLLDLSEA